MKKIKTLRFGEIEEDEGKIIHFAQGLPAFEEEHEFILVLQTMDSPYVFLQSIKTPELAFLMTRPFVFFPSYEFALPEMTREQLALQDSQDVDVYTLITIPEGQIQQMTTNLLAPIVINKCNYEAQQVILERTNYMTKHALFPQPEMSKKGEE
jgi:flagellar assembly factor FliW